MKYIFLILVGFILFPQNIFAHLAGQPPFFKINGIYSDFYHIPLPSLSSFDLPQDMAPESYLVNQPINFEIDENVLPIPKEIVEDTKFLWAYGDGKRVEGFKNTYSYQKSGSYILSIFAQSSQGEEPQLLQSVFLNILPDKNYQLPKAVITINGWQTANPSMDVLEVSFDQILTFDGTNSQSVNKDAEYLWDFGDQYTAKGQRVEHKFNSGIYSVYPILRIKTSDGFITDAQIEIKIGSKILPIFSQNSLSKTTFNYLLLIIPVILTFLIIIGVKYKKKSKL